MLITLCLVCSTIMVKFYEKLWLLKKITNYWHLNFLLLIAPKRGWHLCSINTGPYGENTEIYSSLKLLHWLNLNCASIIGRSFTNFVFFYVDRNSKMTTTAGHSFYIGPIGSFYNQVNDTGSWEPLVVITILVVMMMMIWNILRMLLTIWF